MIDYGEEKQTFGAPRIDVGPVSQLLTALYLGIFVFAFFKPDAVLSSLVQINAELPRKIWTLLTGVFVFPESVAEFAPTPAGFWVVVTFLLIFFVARPLERVLAGRGKFILFLLVFMIGPALVLWRLAPGSGDPVCSWPFWFSAAAGACALKFRKSSIKIGERNIPQTPLFLLVPLAAVLSSAVGGSWSRMLLYILCTLLGLFWGRAPAEPKKNNTASGVEEV